MAAEFVSQWNVWSGLVWFVETRKQLVNVAGNQPNTFLALTFGH